MGTSCVVSGQKKKANLNGKAPRWLHLAAAGAVGEHLQHPPPLLLQHSWYPARHPDLAGVCAWMWAQLSTPPCAPAPSAGAHTSMCAAGDGSD